MNSIGKGYYDAATISVQNATVPRASEVEAQISNLADYIKLAEDHIDQLGARLQGVVRSSPTKGENIATPEAVLVPVASHLRECNRRIEQINVRLGYLLANIEL